MELVPCKKPHQRTCCLFAIRGHSKKETIYKQEIEPSSGTELASTLIWHLDLGLPSLQNCEKINYCCINQPTYDILL